MTASYEMILTEEEKERVISDYIATEKRKKDCVFGKKVRDTDPSLIEYDREGLINNANERKHHEIELSRMKLEEYNREKQKMQDHLNYWSAGRMYSLLVTESESLYGKVFEYNKDNELAVKALCFFLSNDIRFETELGFDFSKGIMLRGKYGTGKTHLIRCLKDNGLRPINIQSMVIIKEKVEAQGYFNYGPGYYISYLDDVGSEDLPIMHFGNKHNWFKDFIEKQYYKNKDFNKIIFSTNLSIKEISEKYSERVSDRIAEMFNIVDFKGTSKRIEQLKNKQKTIKEAEKESNGTEKLNED